MPDLDNALQGQCAICQRRLTIMIDRHDDPPVVWLERCPDHPDADSLITYAPRGKPVFTLIAKSPRGYRVAALRIEARE